MATKEDILEQIVEEYLLHQGYFVRHNLKFLPDKKHLEFVSQEDSNHSDIDVLGYNPLRNGPDRVLAVTCKSWQGGFRPSQWVDAIKNNKKISGRPAWKSFRELVKPKWSDAFVNTVRQATASHEFTYVVAVSKVVGDKAKWEQQTDFRKAMDGNPIQVVTFEEMLIEISRGLTTTLAATEVGRLIQISRAAGLRIGR